MRDAIVEAFEESVRVKEAFLRDNIDNLVLAINAIVGAFQRGNKLLVFGNGGSALTALHYITDWNKSIYLSTGIPFRGRRLCDNIGLMMAYSNDISYEDVFVEQLKNFGRSGDLLFVISASGNSPNVIKAVHWAKKNRLKTISLTGFNGGELKKICHVSIHIPIQDYGLSEGIHSVIHHYIVDGLRIMKNGE